LILTLQGFQIRVDGREHGPTAIEELLPRRRHLEIRRPAAARCGQTLDRPHLLQLEQRGLGVMGDTWLIISIVLTFLAAAVLAFLVLPAQSHVLAAADGTPGVRTAALPKAKALSMTTGIFALLWAVVVVLMIVRPGSTTGV
jgi:hypothetical protein